MQALELPIDSGALYHDQIDDTYVRVRRVFVDEDMEVQVYAYHGLLSEDDGSLYMGTFNTVDLDSFTARLEDDGQLVRCNSDHDAWMFRATHESA